MKYRYWIVVLITLACQSAPLVKDTAMKTPFVQTKAEANALQGQRIQVRGIVRRQKWGNALVSPGFTVICLDVHDLPEGTQSVTGVLHRVGPTGPLVDESGIIAQGVAPGSVYYTLHECKVMHE